MAGLSETRTAAMCSNLEMPSTVEKMLDDHATKAATSANNSRWPQLSPMMAHTGAAIIAVVCGKASKQKSCGMCRRVTIHDISVACAKDLATFEVPRYPDIVCV